MILKFFWPDKEFSFEQLDEITGKYPDGSTWAAQGHVWLVEQGFEVAYWTLIEWEKFAADGSDYLAKEFGQEVAEWQIANTDIEKEQARAQTALRKVPTYQKEPHIADIMRFLDEGYLIKCTVNSSKLNNRDGYAGHVIVVKGYQDGQLIIHDPGLPPLKDRRISYDDFEEAWAYPNKKAKELVAIRVKVKG